MPKYTEYQKVFRVSRTNNTQDGRRARRKTCATPAQALSRTEEQNGDGNNVVNTQAHYAETNQHNTGAGVSKLSEAQRRLQQLEQVVASLVHANPGSSEVVQHLTPPYSDQSASGMTNSEQQEPKMFPRLDPSNGRLEFRGSEANYCGSTHWATILADIKDIQDCLGLQGDDDKSETTISTFTEDPDVVFNDFQPITLTEVCNLLPSRQVADKLLSVFFSAQYLHIPFIHRGKFLKEYEAFWDNPSSVPYLWVSLLFSALHLGSWICQMSGQKMMLSPGQVSVQSFLTIAGQVLVAGQYQKARPYSVEAVLLYAMCKFFQKEDQDTEPWMLMGVSARMALRMGYHRDPRHLSHISPFEGEMRRRAFFVVQTFDLLLSFQAGLPATIHEEACDTEPPSNLLDDDFDEHSTILPPSRPPTDPTPMLYHCYKGRLAQVFRRVARHALSPKFPPYEETMNIDFELQEIHALMPPSLAMKPISSSITDETHVILRRFNIELLYQKSLMILHRNYVSHARSNPAFEYSRRTCLEASLRLLGCQAEVQLASQPGGQLQDNNWLASSITFHDFLLAAMVACLDLYESHRQHGSTVASASAIEAQRKTYNALRVSHSIWSSRKTSSRDARRATAILTVMLAKLPDPSLELVRGDVQNFVNSMSSEGASGQIDPTRHDQAKISSSEPSAAAHSFEDLLVDSLYLDAGGSSENSTFDAILRDTEVDWSLVDQYLLGREFVEGP